MKILIYTIIINRRNYQYEYKSDLFPIQSISFFSNFFEDACAYLRLLSPAKLLGIKVIKVRRNNLLTYP